MTNKESIKLDRRGSLSDQQESAIALFENAINALAQAGLYLHANERGLNINDSQYSTSEWDYDARLNEYHTDVYLYHLSDEQEELGNTLKSLKKLLGKDDD